MTHLPRPLENVFMYDSRNKTRDPWRWWVERSRLLQAKLPWKIFSKTTWINLHRVLNLSCFRPASTTCHPSKHTLHCITTVVVTAGCQYFNCRCSELNCCESLWSYRLYKIHIPPVSEVLQITMGVVCCWAPLWQKRVMTCSDCVRCETLTATVP